MMDLLGRLLWWYVDTLFGAIVFGCNVLWQRYVNRKFTVGGKQ